MSEVLPPDHFEPDALMEALIEGGVRFILIGGLAVGVHGVVRATRDIDIVPEREPDNLERLAAVLRALDARQIGVDAELLPPSRPIRRDWRPAAASSLPPCTASSTSCRRAA